MSRMERPQNPVLTAQIIVAAMLMGIVVFGMVVVLLLEGDGEEPDPMLSIIAVIFAVASIGARFTIPRIVVTAQRRNLAQLADEARQTGLVGLYMTKTIVANALLEGAAFFGLIVYLLDRQPYVLAGVGILVALMLATFPNRGQLDGFLRDQQQLLEQEQR